MGKRKYLFKEINKIISLTNENGREKARDEIQEKEERVTKIIHEFRVARKAKLSQAGRDPCWDGSMRNENENGKT